MRTVNSAYLFHTPAHSSHDFTNCYASIKPEEYYWIFILYLYPEFHQLMSCHILIPTLKYFLLGICGVEHFNMESSMSHMNFDVFQRGQ